jgi:hypothetical protein
MVMVRVTVAAIIIMITVGIVASYSLIPGTDTSTRIGGS